MASPGTLSDIPSLPVQVASGVDLRAVQELGGWRTLSMVQRYAHLSPGQLAAAVEKIVATPVVDSRKRLELRQELRVGSEGSWT